MLKGKILGVAIACTLLAMTACSAPWSAQKEGQVLKGSSKGGQKVTVIPQESSQDYRTIHADQSSDLRGYIQYGVDNRVDIDEMEEGLMRLSKDAFKPDEYYFQQGNYIKPNVIDDMLSRKGDKAHPGGLNPPLGKGKDLGEQASAHPKVLSYVLEQDYLVKAGDNSYKLGGVSLAVSVNSVYTESLYNKKDGKTYTADVTLDKSKAMAEGKTYAQKVLERVRKIKGLENVPIFIALYIEAPPGSYVPGHFYAKTLVGKGQSAIGKWQSVNEDYAMFPTAEADDKYKTDSAKFAKFKEDVEKYFPNSIGIIGKGFYKDGELSELTVTINIRFYDKTEVISFANYVSSLLQSRFPFSQHLPVQIYINSVDQPEAIIVKQPDMDKPFVHIYKLYQ